MTNFLKSDFMKILVTGSKDFVAGNYTADLLTEVTSYPNREIYTEIE